jgi:hypothetical protein
MSADPIVQALAASVGFEAVQVSDTPLTLRVMGRVPIARQPDLIQGVLTTLLRKMRTEKWFLDPSKFYFIPDGQDTAFYAWRLIFESRDASVPLPSEQIAAFIQQSPAVGKTAGGGALTEIKLAGASALRNGPNAKGKGAVSVRK